MFATTLAVMATLEVVLPGKYEESLIAVIVVSFFQLWHIAKLNNVALKAEGIWLRVKGHSVRATLKHFPVQRGLT